MKHFKLFFAICLMSVCVGANAQSEAGKMPFDPRCHFLLETKVGAYHYSRGGFGTNFVLEKEVQKYLAWDIFSVDFSAPWNCDLVSIGLKTGVRGFSPRFWDERIRAFSSLAMGYDCGIITTPIGPGTARAGHGFAFSWGLGVQILEHLFVGYDLEYSTARIDKGKFGIAHYAKLGWRF